MKGALLGFLFILACAGLGFYWGRHKHDEARRQEEAVRSVPPPIVISTTTLEVPPDLPSDQRSGDSIPRGLE